MARAILLAVSRMRSLGRLWAGMGLLAHDDEVPGLVPKQGAALDLTLK